jgi:hypothetical protein
MAPARDFPAGAFPFPPEVRLMPAPRREVFQADALAWLEQSPVVNKTSFITSMPDFSEFPSWGLGEWKEWFRRAARLVIERTPESGVAIFYQRDAKKDGYWVDKGYLIQRAAEEAGAELLWHKIVCRAPPGNVTFGKPAYSHLLCFSKAVRPGLDRSTPDVILAPGKVTWTRGMGSRACVSACRFVAANTDSDTIVDPFCGHGTVLAVANAMGLNAIGVELSRKRAEKARALVATLAEGGRDHFRFEDGDLSNSD